jgi:hypothetical protein
MRWRLGVVCAVVLTIPVAVMWRGCTPGTSQPEARVTEAYRNLPLAFESQPGQSRFTARGQGYSIQIGSAGATLVLKNHDVLRMKMVGANPLTRVSAERELPGRINYITGTDPKNWRTNIPTYARVTERDVYPAVDVLPRRRRRLLRHPGPSRIRLPGASRRRSGKHPPLL